MSLSRFAGQYRAVDFNYGGVFPTSAPRGLTVCAAPGVSGSQTLTVQNGWITLSDGTVVTPFNVNAPVQVINASGSDSQTPSAVSTYIQSNLYGPTATVTATWTYAHYAGDVVASGTYGLQEALNYASAKGGGVVIVDGDWITAGGTQTILAAATVPTGVTILNNSSLGGYAPIQTVTIPLTLAQIQGAFTTPVAVVAAPGVGNLVDVLDATLNLIYGSAAYSGGGAAQLSYGTGVTYPATATWAATDFTALSANSIVKVAGADAFVGSTNYLNKAVNYTNASAVFTGGTGGSGVLIVNYRIVGGLS
jgi:hypothetical protein